MTHAAAYGSKVELQIANPSKQRCRTDVRACPAGAVNRVAGIVRLSGGGSLATLWGGKTSAVLRRLVVDVV